MGNQVQVVRAPATRSVLWRGIRRRASRVALYALLGGWAAMTAYPFYWLVLNSFKRTWEVFQDPFSFPKEWVFQNYADAWRLARVATMSQRSLYVSVVSTVLAIALASTTSFVLSRFSFRGKKLLSGYLMLGFMVPATIRLLPLALFSRTLGVYDSLFGVALIYAASRLPFNSFLLTAFMETVPHELEEAAVMDGAGMWRVFWNVLFPLSQPALVTLATFQALYSWSEFILAFILIESLSKRTLAVGIVSMMGEFFTNYVVLFAASVLAIIPAVIFFLLLQKYVVKGMSAGALKGA